MDRYKNLDKAKKHFSKLGFETICGEIINWDRTLIKKLHNNGQFTSIDIDYLCQLLSDDIEFMKRYLRKNG